MKRIAFIILALLFCKSVYANEIDSGKDIFKSRCSACHAVNEKQVGPALKDVDKRHEQKWLVSFIHSSQTVVKSGDASAVKLFNDNNHIIMPDHKDLTEANVADIISFIKDESKKALQTAVNDNANLIQETTLNDIPISLFDFGTWIFYFLSVSLLALTIYALVVANSILNSRK